MENYYKILEVDVNASEEIIKQAYKTLVKKYHPDLQTDSNKNIAEQKIKQINEAYDILSDSTKRANYNNQLKNSTISSKNYNAILNENIALKKELKILQEKINIFSQYYNTFQNNTQNKLKAWLKHWLKVILSLLLFIFILFLLFNIPYIKNLLNFFTTPSNFYLLIITGILIFLYFQK